ncbi:MAG: type IV secretory system conjugative DNA transfer family protein, partial [Deltaproteobacteria bacterium]
MGKGKVFAAVGLFAVLGLVLGYVIASAWLAFVEHRLKSQIDFAHVARHYLDMRVSDAARFRVINLIIGVTTLVSVMLSLILSNEALTRFGRTHWQKANEMAKNGFFGTPGTGFILGKLGSPKSSGKLISSRVFPHALIVAPTGRGKTSGFVIPNLLTFKGSIVVLDVKGENFEQTSRHRLSQGDEVYRFAPTDWDVSRPSNRYNPLLRIAGLNDPDRQQMELQLLASLFLQTDNDRMSGLLDGGIDLFVAAGLLAFERERPNIGEIYRITASGGDKQKEYLTRAQEVKNPAARLIFERMASTNNDTSIARCSGAGLNLATIYDLTGLTTNWTFNGVAVLNPVSVNT